VTFISSEPANTVNAPAGGAVVPWISSVVLVASIAVRRSVASDDLSPGEELGERHLVGRRVERARAERVDLPDVLAK